MKDIVFYPSLKKLAHAYRAFDAQGHYIDQWPMDTNLDIIIKEASIKLGIHRAFFIIEEQKLIEINNQSALESRSVTDKYDRRFVGKYQITIGAVKIG